MKMPVLVALALIAPFAAHAQPAGAGATFDAMDGNGDGQISRAEYASYLSQRFSEQAEAMDAAFEQIDADRNGLISKEEAAAVPAIASAFDALDANKDGGLSKAEMQDALSKAQALQGAN
ncbi:EF-hand domain-containing protein [Altererythrobacter xixiisoli]|uniref:EF-hand domain-containing protein n=1 Tax=Croceibacterium xixiisoli TaxID=1476466 RepID=A0A6I4TTQ4_9SPHN|nr:EF-hand domain-containing protein [Croceibacterium xixiisoli]MXO98511.1 EF-hand domain-containing protein [Croceibacterium xixiisoli]